MPFHPNIPQVFNDPKKSQQDLLDNFQQINSQFSVDHIALTEAANQGFHRKTTFPGPVSPAPVATGTQGIVYPGISNGNTELFFTNALNNYQLTGLEPIRGKITNVTVGLTTTITSNNHLVQNGDIVTIRNVLGVTGSINDIPYVATFIDANNFSIPVATAGIYTPNSGHFVGTFQHASSKYGFYTPWGWIVNMGFNAAGPSTLYFPAIYGATFEQLTICSGSQGSATGSVFSAWTSTTINISGALGYLIIGRNV